MPDELPTRAVKSAAAFRTISEVSEELEVPQHVLRFWETKFSQVRPLKRAGGRRYYRPADVDLLRKVSTLLYNEGYTIKGVQRLLRERTGKQPAMEPDSVLPFDFTEENRVFPTEDVSNNAEFEAGAKEVQLPVKQMVKKRLDDASRLILETILNELINLQTLLKSDRR